MNSSSGTYTNMTNFKLKTTYKKNFTIRVIKLGKFEINENSFKNYDKKYDIKKIEIIANE